MMIMYIVLYNRLFKLNYDSGWHYMAIVKKTIFDSVISIFISHWFLNIGYWPDNQNCVTLHFHKFTWLNEVYYLKLYMKYMPPISLGWDNYDSWWQSKVGFNPVSGI